MDVIFLDFDGVITNKSTNFKYADPQCIDMLNTIYKETKTHIVITSFWRYDKIDARDRLRQWGFYGDIYGMTPVFKNNQKGYITIPVTRGREIAVYLSEHPEVKRFAIIDDEDVGSFEPYHFKTDMEIGLTWTITADIIKYFQKAKS